MKHILQINDENIIRIEIFTQKNLFCMNNEIITVASYL